MPYVSFTSAPCCLTAAAGLVTPLQTFTGTVHLKTRYLLISGVNQGYHQINWDHNLGYPGFGLVTCGPERVGTGATPTG